MRVKGRQLRFVAGSLGAWVVVRAAAMLWVGADMGEPPIRPAAPRNASFPALPWPRAVPPPPFTSVRAVAWRQNAATRHQAGAGGWPISATPTSVPVRARPATASGIEAGAGRDGRSERAARIAEAVPLSGEVARAASGRNRWSGQAFLFVRPGSGTASLAAGGQLGGSQAAARLAYQLNGDGPVRTAVAARFYAPLASRGAEAALGFDWHPFPAVPLRITVERRFDLDGRGRSAWSAYAAGGFYLERLGGRVSVDGYGQAGVVGIERRDLFVDGAIRAGRRWRLGSAVVTAGAGLWGAAQPAVSRVDVGPRVGVVLPVGGHAVSAAVEGRLRIAGQADPGSGAALTLALDL